MFDIGWSEILLIAVVAIVVVGPKDLPPMLRAAGRMVSKLRRTAGEFQSQFNEALREAELDGVKDSINEIRGLNPMNEIRKSLDPIQAALAKPEGAAKPAPAPVPPPMGQPAQPMTDADLIPAANPLPVDGPAVAAPAAAAAAAVAVPAEAKPAPKKRKPKAVAVEATPEAVADVAAPEVKAPVKRAAKPKAEKPLTDTSEAPKPPRAAKAKPAAAPADTVPIAPAATTPARAEPVQLDMASALAVPARTPVASTGPAAPANEIAAVSPPAEERS